MAQKDIGVNHDNPSRPFFTPFLAPSFFFPLKKRAIIVPIGL